MKDTRTNRKRKYDPALRRKWQIKTRYGLTEAQADAMLAAQGGVCGVCQGKMARPCIDHSHTTGATRGVLCHRCNIRLNAVEDATFREQALTYLARFTR